MSSCIPAMSPFKLLADALICALSYASATKLIGSLFCMRAAGGMRQMCFTVPLLQRLDWTAQTVGQTRGHQLNVSQLGNPTK